MAQNLYQILENFKNKKEITLAEALQSLNMNRSTFYKHYTILNEL